MDIPRTHAVGIDLGTTYSCISYLNEHGEPVTIPNQEGELSTPSVVLFEDTGEPVVGTEALRNSVIKPQRVVQNSKRFMGDSQKKWLIDNNPYDSCDIATLILKKLLAAAEEQIGPVEQAVITVPAQFSELQRQMTVEAGMRAGLKHVDIINEPVAAALCYVLGSEGLWFTELAEEQRIMVYDLGGGTFDLSLVKYHRNEVKVIASAGDLNLGGIDWNRTLLDAIARQFQKEFGSDPRSDPRSLQFLALEVENTKRSLTVRQKSALTVQHGGDRKAYQVEQSQFERLTKKLVDRTCEVTQQMLQDNRMGWAHVDVILTVGGASRMPMIRNALKQLGGRTLNSSLSPDQSIAHGATYYAGMLLTNSDFARSILSEETTARLASIKHQSVNARGLGIMVRDLKDNRVPCYLIPANTPLPANASQKFGTVVPNQKRVHLRIVESGTSPDQPCVELGTCVIENLPRELPENSQIEVTISYTEQARVQVSARDVSSGLQATTEIVREENLTQRDTDVRADAGRGSSKAIDARGDKLAWKAATVRSDASPTARSTVAEDAVPQPRKAPKTERGLGARSESGEVQRPRPATQKAAAARPNSVELDVLNAMPDLPEDEGSILEGAGRPVPLCNDCGEPLDHRGTCPACGPKQPSVPERRPRRPDGNRGDGGRGDGGRGDGGRSAGTQKSRRPGSDRPARSSGSSPSIPVDDAEILELGFADKAETKQPSARPGTQVRKSPRPVKAEDGGPGVTPRKSPSKGPSVKAPPLPPGLSKSEDAPAKPRRKQDPDDGEEEFWKLAD